MKLTRSRSATSGRPAAASVTSRSRNPAAEAKSTSPATVTSTYPGSCRTRIASSSSSSGPWLAASIKTAVSGHTAQPPSVMIPPPPVGSHPRSRRRRGGLPRARSSVRRPSLAKAQTPPRLKLPLGRPKAHHPIYVRRYVTWPATVARGPGVQGRGAGQVSGHGRGPGGHGVMDGPDADRGRLVPAGGEQPGEAAALLRPAVPAGGGG